MALDFSALKKNRGNFDGLMKEVEKINAPIENKKDEPNYKEVSKFVGGMVECVQFPNGDLLLLNEEGKLMQLPLNPEATTLWRATFTKDKYAFGYDDFVVGPAILIKKDALKIWAS